MVLFTALFFASHEDEQPGYSDALAKLPSTSTPLNSEPSQRLLDSCSNVCCIKGGDYAEG